MLVVAAFQLPWLVLSGFNVVDFPFVLLLWVVNPLFFYYYYYFFENSLQFQSIRDVHMKGDLRYFKILFWSLGSWCYEPAVLSSTILLNYFFVLIRFSSRLYGFRNLIVSRSGPSLGWSFGALTRSLFVY